MKSAYWLCWCLFWLGNGQAVAAAESENCAQLEDAQERLACYDARYPRPAEGASVAPAPASEAAEPKLAPSVAAPPSVPVTPALVVEGSTVEMTKPEKGLFGDEKVDMTSSIKAILAGEKQKMVFQLANDQIWIQSAPRPLPFKVGDAVTIRNATLGGYFMRTDKGTSTRVQRIH